MKVVIINGVRVHEEVLSTKFACDYQVCHGRCCNVADDEIVYEGCTLTDAEVEHLQSIRAELVKAKPDLPEKLWYAGSKDKYAAIEPNGKCVFQEAHGCLLSRLDREGLQVKSPIGCRLYPLVVETFKHTHLRVGHYYDKFHLCDCAFAKGKRENTLLIDFCRDSLIEKFGEDFYVKLKKYATRYTLKSQ